MISIKVKTKLLGKAELFKIMALGHSLKKPILFIGQPGVAKTQAMLDYASAVKNYYVENGLKKDYSHFILEANDDSRPSEITGRINLEKLVLDKKYVLHSDIETANAVMINEVDKGTSSFRNAMLSAMNEKVLFRGNEQVALPWELFVGTCNSIPEDEVKSHFFDRFIIKYTVSRLTSTQISTLFKRYEKGSDVIIDEIDIDIPSRSDLDNITIDDNRLSKFISVTYESLSDRTLTYVYDIIRSIMIIWKVNVDKAMMKAAELLVNKSASNKLSNMLFSAEMKEIMNDIELLEMISNNQDQFTKQMKVVTDKISVYASSGALDQSQVETLSDVLMQILPEGFNVADMDLIEINEKVDTLMSSGEPAVNLSGTVSNNYILSVDPFS